MKKILKLTFSCFIFALLLSLNISFAHDYSVDDFEKGLLTNDLSLEEIESILDDDYDTFIEYYLNSQSFYVIKSGSPVSDSSKYYFCFTSSTPNSSNFIRLINGQSWSRSKDVLLQSSLFKTYTIDFDAQTFEYHDAANQNLQWYSLTDYPEFSSIISQPVLSDIMHEAIILSYNGLVGYYNAYASHEFNVFAGDKNFATSPPPELGDDSIDLPVDDLVFGSQPYFINKLKGYYNPGSSVIVNVFDVSR